jgi:phospholipase C
MSSTCEVWKWRAAARVTLVALIAQLMAPAFAAAADNSNNTKTPIKHVIVIIGENRTFDHVFATYQPKAGEHVDNLLSKGIVKADGTPGPKFFKAAQSSAVDDDDDLFQLSPSNKAEYSVLPTPLTDGTPTSASDTSPAPFKTIAAAKKFENGLPEDYYVFLTTGASGLPHKVPDTRIPNVTHLPNGPFQLTSATLPYDSYSASPVHRFYQMWQQLDCNASQGTSRNPAGCKSDLFPWVEVTVGAGTNGKNQPAGFNEESSGEGSTAMGFYNMQKGDVPYFKSLADNFAMSDNFHQSVMGGTGANHVMLGTGDAIWFSDGSGHPAVPPHKQFVAAGLNSGIVDEIENPNAQRGTNNWYTEDGYGNGSFGSPSSGGGTYSDCSNEDAPGVQAVLFYLRSLPYDVSSRCAPGHYYLLNNYAPGYYGDGRNAYADIANPNETVFTIPPSNLRTIGDELLQHSVSWKYYGDQWNAYVANPDGNFVALNDEYCNICNPFQYVSSIMTNAAIRTTHLKDTIDFYSDVQKGTLPAVSFVKPSGYVDGHPASSKLNLFEGFTKKIVNAVKANPTLWKDTAIFVTFDEGGGYYDSGYVQPLDFFGDGTRIPFLVVSRFTKPGHISHDYTDHVSILKFIEANWGLPPVTGRSRDNLPNPLVSETNAYVPTNQPAIGNLMDLFDFSSPQP